MKYIYGLIVTIFLILTIISCQKWQDPKPVTDPRLDSPYCNDPAAVNYNWGFPGRPDDSVCYYPTDIYKGKYKFRDSIFLADNATFSYAIPADSSSYNTLNMYALSKSKMGVVGFCNGMDTLKFTVDRLINATVDTTVADTLSNIFGQILCRVQDTVSGTITKEPFDEGDSIFHVALRVVSDTGITYHRETIIKLK